ncbi:MAG: hypothetical protein WB460_11740 [Candidatus Acidiferrales bacterium]
MILVMECLLARFLAGQSAYGTGGMITTSSLSWGHEVIEAVTALGTLLLAALAIWGDRIKDWLFGPRLELFLVDPRGDRTRRNSGRDVIYYHLRVKNRRLAVAKSVQVLVQGMSRRTPGGTFVPDRIVYPLPLVWTPAEMRQSSRDVFGTSTCDFGFLDLMSPAFEIATQIRPNNFRGGVGAGESVRFEIIAAGENVYFTKALVLQVSWDGNWVDPPIEAHLVIEQVASL